MMDRAIVTGMVEDFWRSLIPAMQGGNSDLAAEMMGRFNERIADTASRMSPIESAGFLQMVDAERDKIINEYQTNPRALKARLDISQGIDGATSPRRERRTW